MSEKFITLFFLFFITVNLIKSSIYGSQVKIVNEEFLIQCYTMYNKTDKVSLYYNGCKIKNDTNNLTYVIKNLKKFDSGVYKCVYPQKKFTSFKSIDLIVYDVPKFKSRSCQYLSYWNENDHATLDCSIVSFITFSYIWLNEDKKIIRTSSNYTFDAFQAFDDRMVYCQIYLNTTMVKEISIKIRVRYNIGAPLIQHIYSSKNGFIIRWYPPTRMYDIRYTTFHCKSENHFSKYKTKTLYSAYISGNFTDGEVFKCSITCYDKYGSSKTAFVTYKYIAAKYQTKIISSIHNGFEAIIVSYDNYINNKSLVMDIKVDNTSTYTNDIVPDSYSLLKYNQIGNIFILNLYRDEEKNHSLGNMLLFTKLNMIYPPPYIVNVIKIKGREVFIQFLPWNNFLETMCYVEVYLIVKPSFINQEYLVFLNTLNATRKNLERYFLFKITQLAGNQQYSIRFRYKYLNSLFFSEFSEKLIFRTKYNLLPKVVVTKSVITQSFIKVCWQVPKLIKPSISHQILTIYNGKAKFRVFLEQEKCKFIKIVKLKRDSITVTLRYYTNYSKSVITYFNFTKVAKSPIIITDRRIVQLKYYRRKFEYFLENMFKNVSKIF